MAMLTSGHCLELTHTKPVIRWVNVACFVAWGAYRGVIGYHGASLANPIGAWGAPEIALLATVVSHEVCGMLPLVCRTARAYAAAIVPWYWCVSMSGVLSDAAEGRYGAMVASATLLSSLSITMRYRQKYSILALCVINLLTRPSEVLAECAFVRERQDNTYGQCVVLGLRGELSIIFLYFALTFFFVGRKSANDISARRATRESREQHRHALSFSLALLFHALDLTLSLTLSLFDFSHWRGMLLECRENTTCTPAPLLFFTPAFFKCSRCAGRCGGRR